jgi:hypothetical protein
MNIKGSSPETRKNKLTVRGDHIEHLASNYCNKRKTVTWNGSEGKRSESNERSSLFRS